MDATLTLQDGMYFTAVPDSGFTVHLESSPAEGQPRRGASPMELLMISLAGCSAMDVWAIAIKKRQAIERYEISAIGLQRDEYPQVLTEVTVTHEVWGPDIAEAAIRRAIELSATKYCPVNAMVSAGATVVHHRYRIHASGATPYEAEGEVLATGPYRRPDILEA